MNQIVLWIVTVIVALMMLGGAIFIARQHKSVPLTEPVIVQPPVEVVRPVVPEPSVTPSTLPATPSPAVLNEVEVDLSKIAGTLKMTSPDIPATQNGQLPRYPLDLTCYRKNASPVLEWKGAPVKTKSYVLVLERRAPAENASWSWIMFNIPATSSGMPGKVTSETITAAQGLLGTNPYGHQEYTGPCEPKGIFPYIIRLFALDIDLPLKAGAGLADILPLINGHVIDAAEIRAEHYLRM